MPRYAAKRDSVEKQIIEGLRAAGYSVAQIDGTGTPDLLVGSNKSGIRLNILFEVKGPGGKREKKLTPAQKDFLVDWHGQATVITSLDEALEDIEEYESVVFGVHDA